MSSEYATIELSLTDIQSSTLLYITDNIEDMKYFVEGIDKTAADLVLSIYSEERGDTEHFVTRSEMDQWFEEYSLVTQRPE